MNTAMSSPSNVAAVTRTWLLCCPGFRVVQGVALWGAAGVNPRGWDEIGDTVDHADFPGLVVDHRVVECAEQHEVADTLLV